MLDVVVENIAMTKTLAFLLSASLAACAGEAQVRYSGTTTEPELVAMENDPDVMVVANADEPVFYVDNTYWLFRDNRWYRSSSHRGGWARIDQPPQHVRRIQRPEVYVHYRHNVNRTTFNERPDAVPTPPDTRDTRPRDVPPGPIHEPNSQGPVQPYPNPLPPQQVPPANPDRHDAMDHQPDRHDSRNDRGDSNDRRDDRHDDRHDDRRDEHDTARGPHPDEH
jgi:hypothetical protein